MWLEEIYRANTSSHEKEGQKQQLLDWGVAYFHGLCDFEKQAMELATSIHPNFKAPAGVGYHELPKCLTLATSNWDKDE